MAVIKAKKKPVIKKGRSYEYNPQTFFKYKCDNFFIIEEPQELLERVEPYEFKRRRFIAFDTETHPYYKSSQEVPPHVVRRWVGSGKRAVPQDYPFCISICDGKNAYSIFDSIENDFAKFRQLCPLFEDATVEKIAHNIKFDMHMLANIGMKICGKLHDTVVLTKITDENRRSFKLKDVAKTHDGIVIFESMVDVYKSTNRIADYRFIPKKLLGEYANADVWNCMLVFLKEYDVLEQDELIPLYENECELTVVLYAMERYGMKIDTEYEQPLKSELQTLADNSEQAIYDIANKYFNINSSKQLYSVLMSLGVDPTWVPSTPKGNPCLNKDVLKELSTKYKVPLVGHILDFRKYEKLLNTYAVGIYDQRDSINRIHGSINQTEATTGRMSITKPALQTLPKKDKRIRRAFIPASTYTLYFMDLDQIEYRLFAHYAKAAELLAAIEKGYDIHAATASIIFGIPMEEMMAGKENPPYNDMRQKGKTVNFALIYGVGITHLAELLDMLQTEAVQLRDRYFAQIPEAKPFIDTVHYVVRMRGYVKNFYGRRRRLKSDEAYKAPNALIQGCAADYIKHRIIEMFKYIQHYGLKTRLINIVHDEVVIEVHNDEVQHVPALRRLLSNFDSFRCPITASVENGALSWGEKVTVPDNSFVEIEDKSFLNYDVFNGRIFDI